MDTPHVVLMALSNANTQLAGIRYGYLSSAKSGRKGGMGKTTALLVVNPNLKGCPQVLERSTFDNSVDHICFCV
jgi:hypothetical protein